MKKLLLLFCAVLSASAMARTIVATNQVDTVYNWDVVDLAGGGVEIRGIDPKPVLDFEIPAVFTSANATYPVKRIAAGAFANSIGLTSIKVPSTVESIGDFAFSNCTSLAEIKLEYGIRSIGLRPFVNTLLTTIDLPDSLFEMKGNIAAGCVNDLMININEEESHFTMSDDGVLYNKDMTRLYSCPVRQEGTINIPDTVEEIMPDAFFGCFRLSYLTIPSSVTKIGDRAFDVAGIWDTLSAPESGYKLQYVFFDGDKPEDPSGKNFGIPPTVDEKTEVGSWTEDDAPVLSIKDAYGITWYYRIVNGCAEIYNNGKAAISPQSTTGGSYKRDLTETTDKTETTTTQVGYGLRIPISINGYPVKVIGENAFKGCQGLICIGLPDTVSEIRAGAFADCTSLMGIDTDDNVPFAYMPGEVILPYGVGKLGAKVFSGTKIQKVTLPASLTEVEGNPVAGCANMTELVAEGNPAFTVVDGVLYNKRKTEVLGVPACLDASAFTLPDGVKSIGKEAFAGCRYLESVTMPTTLATIGEAAFSNCTALVKVLFNGAEPTAADDIYAGADGVTSYVSESAPAWASASTWKDRPLVLMSAGDVMDEDLSESVNGVMWYYRVVNGAAEIWRDDGCAVDMPAGTTALAVPRTLGGKLVKSLGDGALKGCDGVTSVALPDSLQTIGANVFDGCELLSAFTVDGGNLMFVMVDGALYDKDATTLYRCPVNVETVEIPETVKKIAAGALSDCVRLMDLTFLGNAPALEDADEFSATPAGLALTVGAFSTGWKDASTALPTDGKWPQTGSARRTIKHVGDGEEMVDVVQQGDAQWTYEIAGGVAKVTDVSGAAGEVTIPATLGGCPLTEIAPDAFDGLTGITAFKVEKENVAFSAKNGALYSKDGKKLVRVPAQFVAACDATRDEAVREVTSRIIPVLGTGASQWKSESVVDSQTTVTMKFVPTTPVEKLFAGVTEIADHAFTDCGFMREGMTVEGTLTFTSNSVASVTVKVNGKVVSNPVSTPVSQTGSSSGTVVIPFTASNGRTGTTNGVSNASSSYNIEGRKYDSFVSQTKSVIVDSRYTAPMTVPATVKQVGTKAFEGSGFTSVTWNGTAMPLAAARSAGRTEPLLAQTPTAKGSIATMAAGADGQQMASVDMPTAAMTYDGYLVKDGKVAGTIQVKVSKMGKAGKARKATATVQLLGEKKLSLKGELGSDGLVKVAKGARAATLIVDADVMSGVFEGMQVEGVRNVFATRGDAKAAAAAKWQKTWTMAFETLSAEGAGAACADGYSGLTVAVGAKGKTKVTGVLADGTKVSVSAQLLVGDGVACVPVFVPLYTGKTGGFAFVLWLSADGSAEVIGLSDWDATKAKTPFGATWAVIPPAVLGHASVSGTPMLGSLPEGWSLDASDPWKGWNPRVTAKTGAFRASISFYDAAGKKKKAAVTGVVVDGVAYGSAVVKKVFSVPLSVGAN